MTAARGVCAFGKPSAGHAGCGLRGIRVHWPIAPQMSVLLRCDSGRCDGGLSDDSGGDDWDKQWGHHRSCLPLSGGRDGAGLLRPQCREHDSARLGALILRAVDAAIGSAMHTTLLEGRRVCRALCTCAVRIVGLRWRLVTWLARVALMFTIQHNNNRRHVEGVLKVW